MRLSSLCLVVFAALPAIACTQPVDSTDVKTSGVYADMSVVAKGDGSSEVSAGLKVGGSASNTYLVMKGDDKLTASVGSQTTTLSKSGDFYKTTFNIDAGDTQFVIAFMRAAGDVSAPNSTVSLAAPFTIAGIAAGDSISRATGFTATWDPASPADPMDWTLDGDCLFRTHKTISDAGSVTLVTADFDIQQGHEQDKCTANFCVDRTRNGTLDPNFGKGGVIDSAQTRCVAFTSTP